MRNSRISLQHTTWMKMLNFMNYDRVCRTRKLDTQCTEIAISYAVSALLFQIVRKPDRTNGCGSIAEVVSCSVQCDVLRNSALTFTKIRTHYAYPERASVFFARTSRNVLWLLLSENMKICTHF